MAIRTSVTFIFLVSFISPTAAQDRSIDVASLNGQYVPAIVDTAIHTEIPGTAIVKVRLPFPNSASFGSAICRYHIAAQAISKILLRCGLIIPQGYQSFRVESIFLGADGAPGIPAKRAPNGSLYTDHAGQTGTLFITKFLEVEH